MENMNPENPESGTPRTGPGQLLRQARLDLRLAPEDVAQILHLSSKQITALENDDYKSLSGPTYVRGYLRSYAQLLGLSPEKVVESYNGLTIAPKPITLPQSAPPPQITSSDRIVKVATLGVTAILLALVYLWWQSGDEPLDQLAVSPEAAETLVDDRLGPDVTAETGPAAAPAGLPGSAVDGESASAGAVVAPTRNTATPAASPGDLPAVSGNTPNAVPAPKPAGADTAPVERVTTRTRRAVDIPPGVPRARMVLHAIQESWADIRDARDNRLLYENVPAGRRISIEGVAPFSVFVGNADGVRVEFNGQDYDVSRHKRGQVARFTLGEETAVNN
ncbi:MAG: RodZ domain-containing protein [Pseudomonadota bacterium]